MNSRAIQRADLAGKNKLTAVTIHLSPSRKTTTFLELQHDVDGKAILPHSVYNKIIGSVPRGATITIG